jgi:DNA-binding MarR family transcriptional regulator
MTPRIIYLIKRAEIEITARLSLVLEEFSLTPIQYSLLYFIDIDKGDLSSAQLSRRFSVTPQSMNELVQLLEKKKLLKKNIDPAHRRILRISLTKKGKQLLEKSSKALDELEENLFSGLSLTEINELRHLLGMILETTRNKEIVEKQLRLTRTLAR